MVTNPGQSTPVTAKGGRSDCTSRPSVATGEDGLVRSQGECSTGALGQIWPIPYLSALKTIAFDYPVTNAILANTFGYDAGYMARALCLSAACTGFLMRRPLLDYGFGWKQLQSRSLLFSGHNASTPFPCTNLLVRRPFCEH